MAWSRRELLARTGNMAAALALDGCGSAFHGGTTRALPPLRGRVMGAMDAADGAHFLGLFHVARGELVRVPLPWRGHGICPRPGHPAEVVVVERSPGWSFHVVSVDAARVERAVSPRAGMHFLGHAAWEFTGRFLYAAENPYDVAGEDLAPRDSVIGVYDAQAGYARVGELPGHGIGVHELLPGVDGTLMVAVGGIYTHPAREREGLNLDTMAPAMVLMDATGGGLRARHVPSRSTSSVRHLSARREGGAWVALQGHGPPDDAAPLVARADAASWLEVELPAEEAPVMEQYMSGVVVHPRTGLVAVASPRGDRALLLDARGAVVSGVHEENITGTGLLDDHVVMSSGAGALVVVDGEGRWAGRVELPDVFWDNHLVGLPDT